MSSNCCWFTLTERVAGREIEVESRRGGGVAWQICLSVEIHSRDSDEGIPMYIPSHVRGLQHESCSGTAAERPGVVGFARIYSQ